LLREERFVILATVSDGSGGLALGVIFALAMLYFIPTITAFQRKHPSKEAISVLNLLLGWTFIGWVAAMVWAVNVPAKVRVPVAPPQAAAEPIVTALVSAPMKECPACYSSVPEPASICRVCLHKFSIEA